MFVTMPEFEQPMMSQLSGEGQKYWQAVTLSMASPWYLFVYRVQYEDAVVEQTVLVEWEEVLAQLIASVSPEHRRGVCRMEYEGTPHRWTQKWVSALWAAGESEGDIPGGLVFEFDGDHELRDANLHPVAPCASRQLVFALSPQLHTRDDE